MATGSHVSSSNLSTLSRGQGQVRRNGHERIDVFLEPQEASSNTYGSLAFHGRRYSLPSPALPTDVAIRRPRKVPPPLGRHYRRVLVHKTYTTRRGALLLFSEELAERLGESSDEGLRRRHGQLDDGDDDVIKQEMESLHTVDGLAWAVLNYGSKLSDSVCLDFVKGQQVSSHRPSYGPSQVRPGFSAKRYLSRLTRSFDDSFLQRLINNGFVQEKTLFRSNELMPKLKRRINDDLSASPTPYRLLKQMLISPGLLSGYSFYTEPRGAGGNKMSQSGSVSEDGKLQGRVMKVVVREVKNGVSRTMSYGSLSVDNKERALADLLVKSALDHALHQQEPSVDSSSENEFISRKLNLRDAHRHETLTRSKLASVGQLDMVAAVESYLKSQTLAAYDVTAASDGLSSEHGDDVTSVDADDERSEQSFSRSPRLTVANLSTTSRRRRRLQPSSISSSGQAADRQMYHPMTPIADADSTMAVSREVTSFNQWTVLPSINYKPETERHEEESEAGQTPLNNASVLPSQGSDRSRMTQERPVQTSKGPVLFGADLPLAGTPGSAVASSGEQKTTLKPAKKSNRQAAFNGMKRGGLDDVTGSVLVLPGGEVMQIGHTIGLSSQLTTVGGNKRNLSGEDVQQLISKLSEHAREIAALVLSTPGTGQRMEEDALTAAALWTSPEVTSPSVMSWSSETLDDISCGWDSARGSSTPSRAQSVGLPINGMSATPGRINQSQPVNSLAQSMIGEQLNSAALFQDLLVEKLSSVVSQISGSKADSGISKNASVSPELMKALISDKSLKPSDISVLVDPASGNHVISLRQQQQQQQQQQPASSDRENHVGKPVGLQLARSIKLQVNTNTGKAPSTETPLSETPWTEAPSTDGESRKGTLKNVAKKADKEKIVKTIGGRVNDEIQTSATVDSTTNIKLEADRMNKLPTNARKQKKKKMKKLAQFSGEDGMLEHTERRPTGAMVADGEATHGLGDDVTSYMETDGHSKGPVDEENTNEVDPQRRPRVEYDEDDPQRRRDEDVGKGSDNEMEFVIVRDEFRDEERNDWNKADGSKPQNKFLLSPLGMTTDSSGKEDGSESDSLGMKMSGRELREMRAAQRAEKVEKQRLEKERQRREREEQLKSERSEQIRREEMIRELESERIQREEAFRIQKEKREEEKRRQEEEEEARERKLRTDAEREAKQREEYAKKMAAIRAKQAEEDLRKQELEQQRLKEEEEARQLESIMLAQMEELERANYLQKKHEEEELKQQKLEEEKQRREEEDRLAMEEALRLAQELARQQEARRQRLEYNQGLNEEAGRLTHMHAISRAFVYSYVELLNWLKKNTAD